MTDYTDLIARLRIVPLHSGFGSTCHAAADALEAQARRIAELEALCDSSYIAGMKKGWNLCVWGDDKTFSEIVDGTRRDLRAARAALEKKND